MITTFSIVPVIVQFVLIDETCYFFIFQFESFNAFEVFFFKNVGKSACFLQIDMSVSKNIKSSYPYIPPRILQAFEWYHFFLFYGV